MKQYMNENFRHFLHGGDYSPEQWIDTPEVWDEDMRLMKLANCNEMSVGIFSWAKLEPAEGEYDFSFLDTILEEVEDRIDRRDRELEEKLSDQLPAGGVSSGSGSAETFTVVTLTQGQQLVGGIGCEVMLRVGSASCVAASAPGLVDETTGSTLSGGGSLAQNHLYMMTVEDRGVLATAATTKLLVRGDYYIA